MKRIALFFIALAVSTSYSAESLPTLHKIMSHHFAAPYSCKGDYTKSALFLSDFSERLNAPDLLFNGACGSPLYVEASTAGDDFSLVSDLGKVSLASVSASKAFNFRNIVGYDNIFKESMPVVVGHTYVVLVAKGQIRSLYAFTVDFIGSDRSMKIRYAVKSYSIQNSRFEAPGFDWEQGNK